MTTIWIRVITKMKDVICQVSRLIQRMTGKQIQDGPRDLE